MKGSKMLILGGLYLMLLAGNVKANGMIETREITSKHTATMYVRTLTYPGDVIVNEEITKEEYDIIGKLKK